MLILFSIQKKNPPKRQENFIAQMTFHTTCFIHIYYIWNEVCREEKKNHKKEKWKSHFRNNFSLFYSFKKDPSMSKGKCGVIISTFVARTLALKASSKTRKWWNKIVHIHKGVDDDNDGGQRCTVGVWGTKKKCIVVKNLIFTHSSQTKGEKRKIMRQWKFIIIPIWLFVRWRKKWPWKCNGCNFLQFLSNGDALNKFALKI